MVDGAARTHTGRVRSNNEDNFYLQGRYREDVEQGEDEAVCRASDRRFLAAVADGMGGEEQGEKASLMAVRALKPCSFGEISSQAAAAVDEANREICEEIENQGGRRMGSTLVSLYMDEGKAVCCNVGDSRAYLLREGKLFQLSVDHNKAGRMVELGVLTPEQAARHPSRHELTQHLGIFADEMVIEPAVSQTVELEDGDLFLLCSDGLTDMVSMEDMKAVLSGGVSPQEMAKELVRLALAGGGRDNVTVIVLQIREKEPVWRRLFGRAGSKEAKG